MGNLRRVVVKIGTSVLLDSQKRTSLLMAQSIARQVKAVRDMSVEVIVVSSGAIACGLETLDLKRNRLRWRKSRPLRPSVRSC